MKRFYKTVFCFLSLWLVCLTGMVYKIFFHPLLRENSSKYTTYRQAKTPKAPDAVFQQRNGVSKEMWISSRGARVHCHLESPFSTLRFEKNGMDLALMETLSNLKIWMQDSNNNDVRYLRASSGDFNYQNHTLKAHEAFLSSYQVNQPASTLFSCLAKDLTLSFDGSPLAFTASGFSAHLQSSESL
jgi:hypothetical protein